MTEHADAVPELPGHADRAVLVGRAWVPGSIGGPSVIAVRDNEIVDITREVPTSAQLINAPNVLEIAKSAPGTTVCGVAELIRNSDEADRDPSKPWLIAPCDLQAIKACGVTFAESMLERVIEERALGNAGEAVAIRQFLRDAVGVDLRSIVPGSAAAENLKSVLLQEGMWSQYLEVGIGPHAEVFTKAQPMSAVGFGAQMGIRKDSAWNNSEPEIVVVVNSRGEIVGATLGNDLNLRDFEGRSALLLGEAKDNNGSCAIGPFIRLLDPNFTLDDLRRAELTLTISGRDNYVSNFRCSMADISRDVTNLVAQAIGENHQYPDGMMLFLGTQYAPVEDRDVPGEGFTHKQGDRVIIRSELLGSLVNTIGACTKIPPWTFGVSALIGNLASRGLIDRAGER